MNLNFSAILGWLSKGAKGASPLLPAPAPVIVADPPSLPVKQGFAADLWAGPGNTYWDLGRILGSFVILAAVGVVVWGVVRLSKDPDLLGLAGVVTAVGIWIGLKDFAARKPDITVQGDLKQADVAGNINVSGAKQPEDGP